ncbi:ATP-binding protein [Pseudomonas sp. UFMG81]|uniref:ATP-binding protein n=1 Tax=Pseudomonas sp. UFMG81 TaxID=2745936 RepID=UPI00188E0E3D|nr:ATP-binding protein [Pseudomonas sp. UFMG81]
MNNLERSPSGYLLRELKIFNWGSFNGMHLAPIDPAGTSLVGVTGSGKTTIIDGFMTLICLSPRYNLASTGGNDSDRDLVSYVRGMPSLGEGQNLKQKGTRPGQTMSGICATFSRGEQLVRLGAVFFFEGTSSATAELEKNWIYCTNPEQSLESWLETFHDEGKRGLELIENNTQGFWVHSVRRDYMARVRAKFQVSDNALSLLNRAAGIKQLTDIDAIFRDLVLEDRAAFKRADEVVKSFDDLNVIHQELETARAQEQKLKPIAELWVRYQQQDESLAELRLVSELAPIWFAEQSHDLWSAEKRRLEQEIEKALFVMHRLGDQRNVLKQQCDVFLQAYLQKGGASIDQLQRRVEEWIATKRVRATTSAQYQSRMRRLGLSEELSEEGLRQNKELAHQRSDALTRQISEQRSEAFQFGINESDIRARLLALQQEVEEIKQRPGSNLPTGYHQFRTQLADHLGVDEALLPFAAELIQVRADEQEWRGAIERAIGGHRLRVMVPSDKAKAALRWINGRDNHLHVRVLEVDLDTPSRENLPDGYARKLILKPHPYKKAVEALIAELDRHCVESSDALLATPQAMTKEGMMSEQPSFFEKRDQRLLISDWFTGFDNRDRLTYLHQEISDFDGQLEHAHEALCAARDRLGDLEEASNAYQLINDVEFDFIDLHGAESQVIDLQGQLEYLTRPDTDVSTAKSQLDEGHQKAAELEESLFDARDVHTRLVVRLSAATQKVNETQEKAELGLSAEQRASLSKYLPIISPEELSELSNMEMNCYHDQSKAIEKSRDRLEELETELIRKMAEAKAVDNGALVEVGLEVADVLAYLKRLTLLTTEALPEKVERFLTYLNRSSDDGVTQLLSFVEQEVVMIEERIEELNSTLRRVEFQSGKYLRLVTSKVIHKDLVALQSAQRRLNTARFKDDVGETHYRALRSLVENLRSACDRKKTTGARAILDPRYRLEFSVAVVDSVTREATAGRKGSYGDSGGEKEIIASYILTAALGYALCPIGESKPIFSTVVLDEAFSRTSVSVAARIIAALNEFGLHPIFVTPNKELQLLKVHTRSAIIVHKKDGASTMLSMSWEELQNYSNSRKNKGVKGDAGGDA